jgi:pyruvate kinase
MNKRTKIVCTIGPASKKVSKLKAMIRAGMNVARLNLSHGTHESHLELMANIREAAKSVGHPVTILADLQGPKIRLGELPAEGVVLKKGQEVIFSTKIKSYDGKRLPVTYKKLHKDVKKGDRILITDGLYEVVIKKVKDTEIVTKVKNGGKVYSHKGLNFPDTRLSLSSLTPKDRRDIAFAVQAGAEWMALSFVMSAADVRLLRRLIKKAAKKNQILPRIIVKIEKHEAITHFDEIMEETDAVMVARGDLGIEIPAQEVPVHQKRIIEKCRIAGKPVVVATQMLESMTENPRPTRAEVSDVANAVFDHTDAVMLSGESATGKFPLEAVQIMNKIVSEAEESPFDDVPLTADRPEHREASIAHAIKVLALGGHIDGVLASIDMTPWAEEAILTHPEIPLFLAAGDYTKVRQINLRWGVEPFLLKRVTKDNFVRKATKELKKEKLVRPRMRLAVIRERDGLGLEIVRIK